MNETNGVPDSTPPSAPERLAATATGVDLTKPVVGFQTSSPTIASVPVASVPVTGTSAAPLPVVATPAGWYPVAGGQSYWDGAGWTGHHAPALAAVHQQWSYPPVVTDARTNPVEVIIAWILTVITLGYMLPWAVAATRGKSNSWAVGLVNLLLGWTFVGWLVALVMACGAHQVAMARTSR